MVPECSMVSIAMVMYSELEPDISLDAETIKST